MPSGGPHHQSSSGNIPAGRLGRYGDDNSDAAGHMHDRFLERLDKLTTLPEVQAHFATSIAGFGHCQRLRRVPAYGNRSGNTLLFHDWPAAWIALYRKNNFHLVDFSVAEARLRLMPFSWEDVRRTRSMSKPEEELWRTANQWGWTDGLSVPIHGAG